MVQPQLLHDSQNRNTKAEQPSHEGNHQNARECALFVAYFRVIGTGLGIGDFNVADHLRAGFVAGPAVVEESGEGEGDVGGGEDDEVEVAEEEEGFGCDGAEAETMRWLVL